MMFRNGKEDIKGVCGSILPQIPWGDVGSGFFFSLFFVPVKSTHYHITLKDK
jgi:hypothetical protein